MARMLDDRSKLLLKTLVERYIADGTPVGSRTLSRTSGLDLSPATIRNVMADLEELGLIHSPHTSAGRVPTPRGYRIFVDTLLKVQPLELGETAQIEGGIRADEPQRVLSTAASLLSSLSHFAGVVMIPRRTRSRPTASETRTAGMFSESCRASVRVASWAGAVVVMAKDMRVGQGRKGKAKCGKIAG